MTKVLQLLAVCCISIPVTLVNSQDPCDSDLLMEDLSRGRRNPTYTTSANTANLCDYQLDESRWYRFTSAVTDSIPENCVEPGHCGTQWPIWMNGTHPTAAAPGPINVTVCVSNYAGDCCSPSLFRGTIQVKFCQTGITVFYVYRLKNVPLCDMAYCTVKTFFTTTESADVNSTVYGHHPSPTTIASSSQDTTKPFNTFNRSEHRESTEVTSIVGGRHTKSLSTTASSQDTTTPPKTFTTSENGLDSVTIIIIACIIAGFFLLTCAVNAVICYYCQRRKSRVPAQDEVIMASNNNAYDPEENTEYCDTYCEIPADPITTSDYENTRVSPLTAQDTYQQLAIGPPCNTEDEHQYQKINPRSKTSAV